MLSLIISLAVICIIELVVIFFVVKDNINIQTTLEKRVQEASDAVSRAYENRINCIKNEHQKEYNAILERLESIEKAYQDFKSHVHVVSADIPEKRSAMYAAMKLSGGLADFINYDDRTGKCSVIVLNPDEQ